MLISHRKKFIYTKTTKTAGTSVESYFERYCMDDGEWKFAHYREHYVGPSGIIGSRSRNAKSQMWYNHMPAETIKKQIGEDIWNSYFKFSVVRNPYTKLISEADANGTRSIPQFRAWLKSGGGSVDTDKYLIDGELCVDYVIRYEDLREGVKEVCERLDIPFEPIYLPHLKPGYRNRVIPAADYYDEECVKIVKEKFAFELEHFGYGIL